jgi:hypothetical protein
MAGARPRLGPAVVAISAAAHLFLAPLFCLPLDSTANADALEQAVRMADDASIRNPMWRAADTISLYGLLFASGALVFVFEVSPAAVNAGPGLAQLLWKVVDYAHAAVCELSILLVCPHA